MAPEAVYLGLGSNLGDRAGSLLAALARLTARGLVVDRLSSIYQTDPVGYTAQPSFLNMVARCRPGQLDPWALMRLCLETELDLGRRREVPGGPRTIDLDLLLFDHYQVDGSRDGVDLTVPHPRMHERRFVLMPLAEIDPGVPHPVLGATAGELLDRLTDHAGVSLYGQSPRRRS
ncbi:MAG: 2-amino-4-hydroxy-6-hydroxymethyldihydropteridine diphosphokinase [Blastocatellia bacterium]